MKIRSYFHVYAAGAWAAPVRDHWTALGRSGLDDAVMSVGLVGPARDRQVAREMITLRSRQWDIPEPVRWLAADEAWEQLTLAQVHADVQEIPGEFAVCYVHTKGAHDDCDRNVAWRRSMTRRVVYGWEHCLDLLAEGYDTAGCHWLTPDEHHNPPNRPVTTPMYAGNFWWARASYLRALPPPGNEYRHRAEEWIGLGNPKAADLLPGWPEYV
jgi:hypothetical protein